MEDICSNTFTHMYNIKTVFEISLYLVLYTNLLTDIFRFFGIFVAPIFVALSVFLVLLLTYRTFLFSLCGIFTSIT